MTHRERFFATLSAEPLDRPAFFPDISDWYAAGRTPPGQPRSTGAGRLIADDDPLNQTPGTLPKEVAGWTYLDFYRNLDWGLPVHVYDWFETVFDDVRQTLAREGNRRITRLSCPAGELEKIDTMASDGSWCPTSHFVKSPEQLDLMQFVVAHTHFRPCHQRVRQVLETVGQQGVCDIPIMRSPFGKLVHEYMGFEQVVYCLYDRPGLLEEFMEMQEVRDLELVALAAESPARIVILSDHADENLISPDLYRRYCIPFYRKVNAILHRAGKIVSTHLDGNFRGFFPLLGQTGFDLLDGCTPAPMMNYQVEELAQALPPGMSCYCGVPATLLCQRLPDQEIVDFGRRIINAFAAGQGRWRAILNIGDILPPNGDINQVKALRETVKSM